eukprot:4495148-Lingulodinium_polyedra.AAC.1
MPSALRSDACIWGLPDLNAAEREQALAANRMVIGAVSFIRACLKLNIPGYLENPLTSMVWNVPKIQALVRDARVHLCDFDMCQFTTPWKKPTRMLTWLCEFPFP